MTAIMDGQECLFDPVTVSGRTCREPCPATTGRTSRPSSRSSQGSGSRTLPMCLCLRRENGQKPGASTMNWGGGPLPIAYMTHNIGEFRSDADGFLSLRISTGSQRQRFFLTLNCGEKPRNPNPTKLSEILQENPDEKYRLSAKACQGILNRAERRGKELPPELRDALVAQSQQPMEQKKKRGDNLPIGFTNRGYESGEVSETIRSDPHGAYPMVAGTEGSPESTISFQERAGKPGGGKGILIQREHTGTLSSLNNQSVLHSGQHD